MRRIFENLKNLFLPRAKSNMREPFLGLSRGEALALRDLKDHPGWQAYLTTLDSTVNLYAESLLQTRDSAALHELRGMILGLRKAISLVDETAHRVTELDRLDAERAKLDAVNAERRTAGLYGSPAWLPSEPARETL